MKCKFLTSKACASVRFLSTMRILPFWSSGIVVTCFGAVCSGEGDLVLETDPSRTMFPCSSSWKLALPCLLNFYGIFSGFSRLQPFWFGRNRRFLGRNRSLILITKLVNGLGDCVLKWLYQKIRRAGKSVPELEPWNFYFSKLRFDPWVNSARSIFLRDRLQSSSFKGQRILKKN